MGGRVGMYSLISSAVGYAKTAMAGNEVIQNFNQYNGGTYLQGEGGLALTRGRRSILAWRHPGRHNGGP